MKVRTSTEAILFKAIEKNLNEMKQVRELHKPIKIEFYREWYCQHCTEILLELNPKLDNFIDYPCPTMFALDGDHA